MAVVVDALDHIVINVRDVDIAAAWYQRVLGMTRDVWDAGPGRGPVVSMKFGRQKINLRPIAATQEQWFTGRQVAPGSDDLCFLTKASPRRREVADHLRACGVAIEVGRREAGAMGTIVSVYAAIPTAA